MRMTIYEMFIFCELEDTDICDVKYDFANNFACYTKKGDCKDYYDKLMRMFATQIECEHYRPKWYSPCYITEYIEKNIDVFNKFMNEENNESFRPKNYTDIDDETWYDLYMETFKNLINGNYSERQYEKLYKMLGGK